MGFRGSDEHAIQIREGLSNFRIETSQVDIIAYKHFDFPPGYYVKSFTQPDYFSSSVSKIFLSLTAASAALPHIA